MSPLISSSYSIPAFTCFEVSLWSPGSQIVISILCHHFHLSCKRLTLSKAHWAGEKNHEAEHTSWLESIHSYLVTCTQTGGKNVCKMRGSLPVHDKNWLYCCQYLQDIIVTSCLPSTGVSSWLDLYLNTERAPLKHSEWLWWCKWNGATQKYPRWCTSELKGSQMPWVLLLDICSVTA